MNALQLVTTTDRPAFLNSLIGYRPHHQVYIETESYVLKTATSEGELEELFRLRHDIFLGDGQAAASPDGRDTDEFDEICDHLLIQDRISGNLVGTYRLLSSNWSKKFYSQGEFDLTQFLASPGVKLELGRACIHPRFRNGAIIDLLWRGIGEYTKLTGAVAMFGCSSVKTVCPITSSRLYYYLEGSGLIENQYNVHPTAKHDMHLVCPLGLSGDEMKELPPLLRTYLSAGARVHGRPALDEPFGCIDFLTVLRVHQMSVAFKRRYFKELV